VIEMNGKVASACGRLRFATSLIGDTQADHSFHDAVHWKVNDLL